MKKNSLASLFLVVAITGCAALTERFPITEEAKKYQAAKASFDQGKYQAAHDAYRAIAESRSAWAEEAKFHAAYTLVYYKNPAKDYVGAEREFEEFQVKYPASEFAGEAQSWLAALGMLGQSKTGELLKETAALTAKSEAASKELREAQTAREALAKEKDALLAEKAGLTGRVDSLVREQETLNKKIAALAMDIELLNKDKAALNKDKAGLEKRLDALQKEKSALIEAKKKLEKKLRDITMVDVKMEKQRKKIKTEEKK
jgi:FtsZ-binding cell division protein ZapB